MHEDVSVHPELRGLARLLGTWEGDGVGHYPTIDAFRYRERVTVGHVGKPFLAYQQQTWHPEAGTPMHAEVGYLRVAGPAPDENDVDTAQHRPLAVELLLAHPTGIAEVEEGTFVESVLRLVTTSIGLTSTAKPVRRLRRELRVQGDELAYDLWMAHADTPETHHLAATLTRCD